MPIKSTFAVEIGEGVDRFKEFEKLFEKYRDRLGKTPSAWAAVSKTNKEVENSFKSMTAALLAQSEILKTEARTQDKVEAGTNRMAASWRSIASHSRTFFNNLTSVATHHAVWGLLGLGGSLWGLERLASAAGAGRKQSTGLGLGYGEMSAFGLTYGRVIEPGSFLSAVSAARGNVGGGEASALMALGINPMGAGNTGDTARQALRRIYEMARGTPEHLLGPMLQEGYGLGNLGMSIEDLRRLKGMSGSEFERYASQLGTRTNQLGVSEETLRKWQDFVNTLDVTGKRIESSLIRGLVKAAGPLEKLSDAAASVVERFVSSKGFKWVVDQVTDGLEAFAKYLGTEKFKQDMRDLASGIAAMAEWAIKFARWVAGGTASGASSTGFKPSMTYEEWVRRREEAARQYDPTLQRADTQRYLANNRQSYNDYLKQQGAYNYDIWGGKGKQSGIMAMGDLLQTVARLEGSGDNAVSPAGAIGKYQIMPSTAAGYGVSAFELRDPLTNEATAKRILTDLSKRYDTTAQVLAAYNAGPMIADYLKAHGDKSLPMKRPDTGGDWDYHQTQEYLRRAGIRVTIDNPAGSTVATQADMLGGSYPGVVP